MLFSQSLMLKEILTEEEINIIDNYFANLVPSNSDMLTVSKIAKATGISPDIVVSILKLGIESKLVKMKYAVRCPDCGMINKVYTEETECYERLTCYWCNEEIEVCEDHIICIFEIVNSFFDIGQHQRVNTVNMPDAVPEDSLAYYNSIQQYITLQIRNSEQEQLLKEKRRRLRPLKITAQISVCILGILLCTYFYLRDGEGGVTFITAIFTILLECIIYKG